MNQYTINVNLIPGLPKNPYRNGVGQYEGVVMHATAVYNDTANGERNYETNHWQDAFVHAFVDDTQILQTADFNYIAWHAAYTANQRFLGFELTQTADSVKFAAAYDRWIWLAARKLFDLKLGVVDGVTILSHKQVSDLWKETDHTDPIEYLASHGKSWTDVVSDVTAKYKLMEVVAMLDKDAAQKVVNILGAVYNATNDPKVQEAAHFAADALRGATGIPKQ
ncbi:N-acetylmuramoyl-L-alanine amidase [Fodinisporobacter ferrooxydans]|uniref:N-acetylmuramoyl-L-alanine amidase n=1 Tax=Fodinisporobacter ferrooxydans TaxID=2901836 RepID=A0ABY4CJQ0_9BACL|nr:N-acetylmuramoyl-L-alanine amidase [Alicyclobacillaceae bacterium MYW30-H2]